MATEPAGSGRRGRKAEEATMICPVCYSRVRVNSGTDRKRIEAGNGCGNWRCV